MPGVGGLERGVERLHVADLTDQDDVRVLAEHVAERRGERERVGAHLALRDVGQVVAVEELDRVLDRNHVGAAVLIDVVDERGQRRALARAGNPGDEHQAAGPERDLLEHRREVELPDGLHLVGDGPEGEGEGAALLVDVGAEPAHARHADGEVGLLALGELLHLPGRHDLLGEELQVLGLERGHVEGDQLAVEAHGRRAPDLEQQVRAVALDHLRDRLLEVERCRSRGGVSHWDRPGRGPVRTRRAARPRHRSRESRRPPRTRSRS